MPSRTVQIKGSVLIDKVKISAAARKALQNITLNIDDKSLQNALSGVNQKIRNIAGTVQKLGSGGGSGNGGVQRLATSLTSVSQAASGANRNLKNTELQILQVLRKASAFRVSTIIINNFVNAITNGFSAFVAFDKALRNINKIAQLNDADLQRLGGTILQLASQYNQSASAALEAFRTISQLGFASRAQEVDVFRKALLIAQTSTLDLKGSIDLLVSVANQQGISFDAAARKIAEFSAIEDASAIDIKDLAEITSRAGTSIAQSFKSSAEAAGLFAAVAERTRAGGAVVGTFAKTLIARLGGANKDVTKTFNDLGVSISDATGKLKDPIQLLSELKVALTGFSEEDIGNVLGKIGGIRQIEQFRALLDSLGDGVTKTGRAFQLASAATASYSSQVVKADQDSKSFAAQLTKIKNSLLTTLAEGSQTTILPFFEKLISVGNTLASVFGGVGKAFDALFTGTGIAAFSLILNNLSEGRLRNKISNFSSAASINRVNSGLGLRPTNPSITGTAESDLLRIIKIKDAEKTQLLARIGASNARDRFFDPLQVGSTARTANAAGAFFDKKRFVSSTVDKNGQLASVESPVIQSRVVGKAASAVAKTLGVVNIAMAKFGEAVPPFSLRAVALGLGFNIVGGGIEQFGESLQLSGDKTKDAIGTLVKSAGDATSTFGMMLPFGVQIAAVSAALKFAGNVAADTFEAIKVKGGDLAATFEFLSKRGAEAPEVKRELNVQRILKETQRQEFTPEFKNDAERIATVLGQVSASIKERAAAIPDALERQKFAARQFASELQNLEKVFPGVQDALLGRVNKGGLKTTGLLQNENFRSLIPSQTFADSLAEAVKGLGGDDIKNSTNAINVLAAAAAQLTPEETALAYARNRTAAASEEDLDAEKELRKVKKELAISSLELIKAEQDLISNRRNLSDLESFNKTFELQKQISNARIAALKEEYEGIKAINDQRDASRRSNIETEILSLEAQKADIPKSALDFIERVNNIDAQIKAKTDELGKDRPVSRDKEDELKLKLQTSINEAEAQNIELQSRLVELTRKNSLDRINDEGELSRVLLETSDAAQQLGLTLKEALAPEVAKQQASISIESAQIRLQLAKRELDVMKEANKEGLRREIIELKGRVGSRSPEDIQKNGTKEEQADLAKLKKLEDDYNHGRLEDTQAIKDATLKVFVEEKKLEQARISGATSILKAERDLARDRISTAATLIVKTRELRDTIRSTFTAQKSLTDAIRGKIDEAAQNIKSKRSDLSSAFDNLRSAREGLFNALRQGADGFSEYSLSVAKANVESQKILGAFFGIRDEAVALKTAFDQTISAAQLAGATEQQLSKLRADSAKEQLSLFTDLLSQQRSKAEQFFTSSAEDRLGFVQGLASINQIVAQFNGNIENFRNLNEGQLNSFGKSLISIPQDIREKIVGALDQLPNGVGIGGLTADQIKEVLQGGALGKSQGLGIESLSEDIKTVAELTKQSVELDKSNLAANQQQINDARIAVENAKEQVLIAKVALQQAQNDAIKTQAAIREVTNTLNSQIGEYRSEFKAEVQRIVNSNLTAVEKTAALAELSKAAQEKIADSISNIAGLVNSITPGGPSSVSTVRAGIPTGGASGQDLLNTVLPAFSDSVGKLTSELGLSRAANQSVAENLGEASRQLGTVATNLLNRSTQKLEEIKAEVTINQDQKITVTGAAEFSQRILSELQKRGFVTQDQIGNIEETILEITRQLISEGIARYSDFPSLTGR